MRFTFSADRVSIPRFISRTRLPILATAMLCMMGCNGATSRVSEAAANQHGMAAPPTGAAPTAATAQVESDLANYLQMVQQNAGGKTVPPSDDEVAWLQSTTEPGQIKIVPNVIVNRQPAQTEAPALPEQTADATPLPAPPKETEQTQAESSTNETAVVAIAPQPLTREELVAQLAEELKVDMSLPEQQFHAGVGLAALTLIDPHYEVDETQLHSLKARDRQAVLAVQRFTASLSRQIPNADDKVSALNLAAANVVEQTAGNDGLRILNARLCERVASYGVYEELNNYRFLSGRENPMIVYAELENFVAHRSSGGMYAVQLSQEIVLYNESDGLAVWRVKPTASLDESRNLRRDFFITQIVTLPSRLSVGKYMLSVQITDQNSGMFDEVKIPVQIVADRTLAE